MPHGGRGSPFHSGEAALTRPAQAQKTRAQSLKAQFSQTPPPRRQWAPLARLWERRPIIFLRFLTTHSLLSRQPPQLPRPTWRCRPHRPRKVRVQGTTFSRPQEGHPPSAVHQLPSEAAPAASTTTASCSCSPCRTAGSLRKGLLSC